MTIINIALKVRSRVTVTVSNKNIANGLAGCMQI